MCIMTPAGKNCCRERNLTEDPHEALPLPPLMASSSLTRLGLSSLTLLPHVVVLILVCSSPKTENSCSLSNCLDMTQDSLLLNFAFFPSRLKPCRFLPSSFLKGLWSRADSTSWAVSEATCHLAGGPGWGDTGRRVVAEGPELLLPLPLTV